MSVIKVEHLDKLYELGQVGTGTLSKDLNRFWARIRGKEDPYALVGQSNDRTKKASPHTSVWALKDINFSVSQGEVIGIIGRNGAGKSTLLKIISRITTPTNGSVKVKGRIASLLEVGTGFHPEMTGRENVFMNGTLLGMTRGEIQRKLDQIIDFAGVAMYIDTPVKRYSSGMQVRLAFAVGAFLEPEILIVDEVLAVGDVEFQRKAIGRMQEVSKEGGRTVLFVSHNLGAISELCSSCMLLHNGTLLASDKTPVILNRYVELNNKEGGHYLGKSNSEITIVESYLTLHESNQPRAIFSINDSINLTVKIHSEIEDRNINIGLALLDKFSKKIFTDVFDYKNFKRGHSVLCIKLPADLLMPGTYSFDVAVFKGKKLVYDYASSICSFTIEDTGFELSAYASDSDIGLIRAKCNWQIIS